MDRSSIFEAFGKWLLESKIFELIDRNLALFLIVLSILSFFAIRFHLRTKKEQKRIREEIAHQRQKRQKKT